MKICIVAINASYIHTSLSCRYLHRSCKGLNTYTHEATINDRVEHIVAALYKKHAEVYAFSCYIWNIEVVLEAASRLKTVLPECKILLGGPEVSYDAAQVLEQNPFVDYIVCGEGELAFSQFAAGADISGIEGFTFRKSGKIIQNGMAIVEDLNVLPRLYTKEELASLGNRLIYYETSRGCPFGCSYCLSSTTRGVRFFDLDRVFEDLKLFLDAKVKMVKFVDRTFNIDVRRTMQIVKFLLKENGSTCFHFEMAADLLTDELIYLFRSAPEGMFQFEIGVQSTNPKTIQAVNRKMDFLKLSKNVHALRQNDNIHLHLDLIAGLPYEDFLSFQKSFDDVYALRPHTLQLGFLKLLKGSKIRKEADLHGYIYTEKPPYEVLGNDYITYGQLLELKAVEDLVEKYHNSGVFEKSLPYAIEKLGAGAFGFYLTFSKYWLQNGYHERRHSRKGLYDIFCAFFLEQTGGDDPLFRDLLKFDFVWHNRGDALPDWAEDSGGKAFYRRVSTFLAAGGKQKYLPHYSNLRQIDLMKRIRAEKFQFDVVGTRKFCENVIIFDYSSKKYVKISENL